MAADETAATPWLMLTVVGTDRAGIVARLTDALYRGGCNLGEASMARLALRMSLPTTWARPPMTS